MEARRINCPCLTYQFTRWYLKTNKIVEKILSGSQTAEGTRKIFIPQNITQTLSQKLNSCSSDIVSETALACLVTQTQPQGQKNNFISSLTKVSYILNCKTILI